MTRKKREDTFKVGGHQEEVEGKWALIRKNGVRKVGLGGKENSWIIRNINKFLL